MSKKEETKKTAETSAAEESSKAAAPKATRGTGKKIKYGSMSMGIVIVVIAIVVLLNLMCGLVVKRYPVKLDLTSDNRYDLSDESIDALHDDSFIIEARICSGAACFFLSLWAMAKEFSRMRLVAVVK